jgi:hypothetical protein
MVLDGAGIFTNICPKNHPNVRKYTIHGAYGTGFHMVSFMVSVSAIESSEILRT